MRSQFDLRSRVRAFFEKYGIVFSGALIFAYYLWAAVDLFTGANPRRGFVGYFFQFSSVILLWGLLFLGSKLFDNKKRQREEQEKNKVIALEFERRKMQLDVLDEIFGLLSDTVNNPLAIISLSATSIRERFASDAEVLAHLDSIEGALRRVREVLNDFQTYQTKKIVKSLQSVAAQSSKTEHSALSVDTSGDIHSI